MAEINGIGANRPLPEAAGKATGRTEAGRTFADLLEDAIHEANRLQKDSDDQIGKLLAGEETDLHTVLIAMQKAQISFQLLMQVRNKIVEAYQEISRMQF